MTVQTIPSIEEMTPSQRAELMEELWKAMSRSSDEREPSERHKRILAQRRAEVEKGEVDYIDWDEAKIQIRSKIK